MASAAERSKAIISTTLRSTGAIAEDDVGDVGAALLGRLLGLPALFLELEGADHDEPAGGESDDGHPEEVNDQVGDAHVRDGAAEDHARNDGACKLADVPEPEVDGRLALAADVHAFAGRLDDRGGKACAADRGEQPEEGRHRGDDDLRGGEEAVERVDHALEGAGLAKLDLKAHHEIECEEKVVGAPHREHVATGFAERAQGGVFEKPEQGAARQNGGADRTLEPQQDDDEDDGRCNEEKYIHFFCESILDKWRRAGYGDAVSVHLEIVCRFAEISKKIDNPVRGFKLQYVHGGLHLGHRIDDRGGVICHRWENDRMVPEDACTGRGQEDGRRGPGPEGAGRLQGEKGTSQREMIVGLR